MRVVKASSFGLVIALALVSQSCGKERAPVDRVGTNAVKKSFRTPIAGYGRSSSITTPELPAHLVGTSSRWLPVGTRSSCRPFDASRGDRTRFIRTFPVRTAIRTATALACVTLTPGPS